MIITVQIKMPGSSRKPLKGTLEVRGPCDTGSIVTTVTDFVVGKMIRLLPTEVIEVEVEPSVYEHYRRVEKWKDAY